MDRQTGGIAGLRAEHCAAAVENGVTILRKSELPDGLLDLWVGIRVDTCMGMSTAAWTWRPQMSISRGVGEHSMCTDSRMWFGHGPGAPEAAAHGRTAFVPTSLWSQFVRRKWDMGWVLGEGDSPCLMGTECPWGGW